MNNYIDKWGRFHHKPVTESNPIPSGNGWIYTAYAQKLGLELNSKLLIECFLQCREDNPYFNRIYRSPGKELPPISRDEILGISALRLLDSDLVEEWNFSPRLLPAFNLFKLIAQLWQLRPNIVELGDFWGLVKSKNNTRIPFTTYFIATKHRNYFWENNLDQLYRFAFSVPLVDRHFILQKWGKFNVLYWAIAKLDSLSSKKSGIRWLKYGKDLAAMLEEFPADHPFRLTTPKI